MKKIKHLVFLCLLLEFGLFCIKATAKPNTVSASRFVLYDTGIIYDSKNNLEWYVGTDTDTTWSEAKRWTVELGVDGGGWRMPTRKELYGIYQRGAGDRNIVPPFKTTGWWVWSGEKEQGDSSSAWIFSFSDGNDHWVACDNSFPVRKFAVRLKSGGQEEHFTANKNGIVYDTKTQLEWYSGEDKDTSWSEAKRWVDELSVGGGGWRMPTIEEIQTLYVKGLGTRNITRLLKNSGWWVWSNKTNGPSSAWAVSLKDNHSFWLYNNVSDYSRGIAVRSRK